MDQFSRRGKTNDDDWQAFAPHIHYMSGDYGDPAAYATLSDSLSKMDGEGYTKANHVFYLAVPPGNVEVIVQRLGKANLSRDRKQDRIVIEKPFGRDLSSARTLNHTLTSIFDESQIYRIDHYLGKRLCRTSWLCVSPMPYLSQSGTDITLTTFRSRWQRMLGWGIAEATTNGPEPCAI